MKLRKIIGLLMVLIFCSCSQRTPKGRLQIGSGLQIKNGLTRGQFYTDTLGTKYGFVYIKTTITNDSTIPIHLQISFSKEYNYPVDYGDEQYKVILLPKEFTLDGVEITDSMLNELLKYIDKPVFNKTLEPREESDLAIGILRPSRAELCSATPYAVLEYSDRKFFPSCEWVMNVGQSSNPQLTLGLKVGFCTIGQEYESCIIIPCGQISYAEY